MTTDATRSSATNYFFWKLCAWVGPVYLVLTLVCWVFIAGFVPVRPEHWSADQIYQYYVDHSLRLRAGLILTILVQPLYVVWGAVIWRIMQRVEGPGGILGMLQLLGAIMTWVIIWGGCSFWLGAAFRPELRTPQEVMLLNDMGWLLIYISFTCTALQFLAIGAAFLLDRRKPPLVPAWMCWFTFAATAILSVFALVPFFNDGPFSWHGLISFWLGNIDFFVWIIPMSYFIIRAVKRLEQEEYVR